MSKSNPAPILIFTGAGASASSGIPTFRGAGGLWQGFRIEEVCHIGTFRENRDRIFTFYNALKQQYSQSQPNATHRCIAAIQREYGPELVQVVTSNVDDLLEQAGCEGVLHVHGRMDEMNCRACRHSWKIGAKPFSLTDCPRCGGKNTSKPGVIFFGEMAPAYETLHSWCKDATYRNAIGETCRRLKLVIGTTLQVVSESHLMTDRGYSVYIDAAPAFTLGFNEILTGASDDLVDEIQALVRNKVPLEWVGR